VGHLAEAIHLAGAARDTQVAGRRMAAVTAPVASTGQDRRSIAAEATIDPIMETATGGNLAETRAEETPAETRAEIIETRGTPETTETVGTVETVEIRGTIGEARATDTPALVQGDGVPHRQVPTDHRHRVLDRRTTSPPRDPAAPARGRAVRPPSIMRRPRQRPPITSGRAARIHKRPHSSNSGTSGSSGVPNNANKELRQRVQRSPHGSQAALSRRANGAPHGQLPPDRRRPPRPIAKHSNSGASGNSGRRCSNKQRSRAQSPPQRTAPPTQARQRPAAVSTLRSNTNSSNSTLNGSSSTRTCTSSTTRPDSTSSLGCSHRACWHHEPSWPSLPG